MFIVYVKDMDLGRLFGSRVRAETLVALAATPKPQSAYRLAKAVGAQPIQVLKLLNELVPLVERGRDGWVLKDDLLRPFLAQELRAREQLSRDDKDALLREFGLRPRAGRGRL